MSTLAVKRLMKEYKKLQANPVESILAKPSEGSLLKWNFVLHSLDHPDYRGGVYMGRILFPTEYPMKPPDLIFLTPNGRFETNKKICMSFTAYHPESWECSWTVENMLIGLISFMLSEENTLGAIRCSSGQRREYARESIMFNMADKEFVSLFKEDFDKIGVDLDKIASGEQMDAPQPKPTPTNPTSPAHPQPANPQGDLIRGINKSFLILGILLAILLWNYLTSGKITLKLF